MGWSGDAEIECGYGAPQLAARRHAKFGEDLAQMPFHRARTDEKMAGDFGVRVAVARQSGDVTFLGRQLHCRPVAPLAAQGLARGLKFAARPPGEARAAPADFRPFRSGCSAFTG